MWVTGATAAVLAGGGNWKPQILIAGLYFAGALLLGALVIALASRWRRRANDYSLPPDAQLAHFRSLYEQGTISAEEFDRLRTALLGTGGRPPAAANPSTTGIRPDKPGDAPPANGSPPDGIKPA
jgi:hypothetical protein